MISNHKFGNQAGYTLLELLVSVALGGIILGTLTTSFISQSKSYDAQEQINEMQQTTRSVMDMMIREIRMAGFDPSGANIVGVPYSATQLETRADLDENGDTAGTDEEIIYSYNPGNDQILRNGELLAENIVGVGGSDGFTFDYLDDAGNSTTNPALTRQIVVTITARTAGIDPNYPTNGGYRTYTLTSVITPRNLVL